MYRAMEYVLRIVGVGLQAWRRPGLGPFDTSVVPMRVWPTDLDTNGHMNNGRYLTIMDFGRTDLVIRTGMARLMWQRRWWPALGAATIRFRRSLLALRRYELHTRVVCWDSKWFFIEQTFVHGGDAYAQAVVKGLLRSKQGNVIPAAIFTDIGAPPESPPMPRHVSRWLEAEQALKEIR
jgi:acyl-CoA thioesterase FadM